jgi:phage terminase small subunit
MREPRRRRPFVTTKTGQRRVNPLIRIASQAQADMLKFGSAFGLTPVGRLRLSGVTPPPGQPAQAGFRLAA